MQFFVSLFANDAFGIENFAVPIISICEASVLLFGYSEQILYLKYFISPTT